MDMMIEGEIGDKILHPRSEQVMLDRDLAVLYGVETKVLNQAVKRNIKRFPNDFMFRISEKEKYELVTKCDRFAKLKHSSSLPFAFTEQGIYMLATVLKSDIAIEVNIAIIRTFKKLREFTHHYNALAKKLLDTDRKHDKQYRELKKALDELVASSEVKAIRQIGFVHENDQ